MGNKRRLRVTRVDESEFRSVYNQSRPETQLQALLGANLRRERWCATSCHALVHSEELERLSAEAKALEANGRLAAGAREMADRASVAAANFEASGLDQATRASTRCCCRCAAARGQ